jgi:hypothetical protein
LGSGARGKKFRVYSIATIIAMLIFGAYTGTQASRVAENLSTPWLGITESVSVYSPIVWMLVLAMVLLQAKRYRQHFRQNTR